MADELIMAGGNSSKNNVLFYLYTGNQYYTMTPSYFRQLAGSMQMYLFTSYGRVSKYVSTSSKVTRVSPVINIDPSKITFSGNGTMSDPYILS